MVSSGQFNSGGIAITTLLVVLLVVVIALACFAFYKVYTLSRKDKQQGPAATGPVDPFATTDTDAMRGDPRALRAGDIVDISGDTYTVRGSMRLREGGFQWSEHLLDNSTGVKKWLSVEEDPDLELVLWTEIDDAPPATGPEVTYNGRQFRLDESGTAQFSSEATTGLAPSGGVAYRDYEALDGTLLSYEDYGPDGTFECAIGQEIDRVAMMIYPQSRT